jgi:hypothetical protein
VSLTYVDHVVIIFLKVEFHLPEYLKRKAKYANVEAGKEVLISTVSIILSVREFVTIKE